MPVSGCYEFSSVMSAFLNSGRSDAWKWWLLSGCFRPKADAGRTTLLCRLKLLEVANYASLDPICLIPNRD
jgi:hypothetical protein